MPANPVPAEVTLHDGSSVMIRLVGDHLGHLAVLEANGQVVVPVAPPAGSSGNGVDFRYAEVNATTGEAMPTGPRVGEVDPATFAKVDPAQVRVPEAAQASKPMAQLRRRPPHWKGGEADDAEGKWAGKDDGAGQQGRRRRRLGDTPASGDILNLMCIFKFADHTARTLPTRAQLTSLMNDPGGGTDAPTGSVWDVYNENSYSKLNLTSVVTPWYTCSLTEAEAAGTASATGSDSQIQQCMQECLADAAEDFDFAMFDSNTDGEIDAVGFLHSGYAAETGAKDCYNAPYTQRVWSHQWSFWQKSSTRGWHVDAFVSAGVRVPDYHISPAVWGYCGSEIGRVGVIAHETGHFLGLPDLYDSSNAGRGIGTWGLMSDAWGTRGDQYYPPAFTSWSRLTLGWVDTVILVDDVCDGGAYSLRSIGSTSELMKITFGFSNPDEYLLVANRRPHGMDSKAPGDGLLVLHVDEGESCNCVRGYPGQSCYPWSGDHYKVAVVQADGKFELEKGSAADSDDVFIGSGAELGDCGPSSCQPNTRAYAGGEYAATGVRLYDVSAAGDTVTFKVQLDGGIAYDLFDSDSCGAGVSKSGCTDCRGNDCTNQESAIGDSVCDAGGWGLYFNCAGFNFDEGDCDCDGGDECIFTTSSPTTTNNDLVCNESTAAATGGPTADSTTVAPATNRAATVDSVRTGTPLPCDTFPDYANDGYCDDDRRGAENNLNTEACGWDGGDCCACSCGCTLYCAAECGSGGYWNCLDPDAQDASCTTVAAVGCVGEWGAWAACDCGAGETTRTFVVTTAAQGLGRDCVAEDEEEDTQACACTTAPASTVSPLCDAGEGDGRCDQGLGCNRVGHNWDGGDCCASTCTAGTYNCSTAPTCLDPAAAENAADAGGACGARPFSWVGDGHCDTVALVNGATVYFNRAACGWDGGDCCLSTCARLHGTENCTTATGRGDVGDGDANTAAARRACLDPGATENAAAAETAGGNCTIRPQGWVGDGHCDSEPLLFNGGNASTAARLNTAACAWDGGDCCRDTCNATLLGDCEDWAAAKACADPGLPRNSACSAVPVSWLGDGFCDAEANTFACAYDGGDCCEDTCSSNHDACDDGATCNGFSCDAHVALGANCSYLEAVLGCNCTGCLCNATVVQEPFACGTAGYTCVDPIVQESSEKCAVAELSWIGDGFCDTDNFNTRRCNWDGGDCCPATCASVGYECGLAGYACLDPGVIAPCTQPPGWAGDGYCDTSFNSDRCAWDGGDCCRGSCEPWCAGGECQYECGVPGYDCQDAAFETTTTGTTTTTTLQPPDCTGSTAPEGCLTVTAKEVTEADCEEYEATALTGATLARVFQSFARAVGDEAADEYFHTSAGLGVWCTVRGLNVAIAVRAAYRKQFLAAFEQRLEADSIVFGSHVYMFGVALEFSVDVVPITKAPVTENTFLDIGASPAGVGCGVASALGAAWWWVVRAGRRP